MIVFIIKKDVINIIINLKLYYIYYLIGNKVIHKNLF